MREETLMVTVIIPQELNIWVDIIDIIWVMYVSLTVLNIVVRLFDVK